MLALIPTVNTTTKPYIPLPDSLSHKMKTLIAISRRVESLLYGLSYGLFTTELEHRDAYTRMTHLRSKYAALRPEVDAELVYLGYRTGLDVPFSNASSGPASPSSIIPQGHKKGGHTHRYGPTSPQYTVDKALKRKANKIPSPFTQPAFKKQRMASTESDFVETDCESESEGKRKLEVEARWPPDPITSLASMPLGKRERESLERWSWVNAITRKGTRREAETERVESPLGTTACW
ncbi:uncharacterized protein N0V89_008213 [Didymosphaeria variabile]|uniref:Uncharacterized protein n=1 Tax=Didymosphaeria variabile TaxID=1932322 RepID=A0A9W9C948_9PLEO|nr:uncharacterized protein N0V89_008213 [Didymosphaeria variabile]KAJ4349597.1 hypothetical protein N0V89_008213 [Didymosphaeria variabile]